jgi:hypothetical protein
MDITSYADFTTEIDPTILQDVESRLRAVLKQKWPQLDTSPSCVFGNLFITPAARVVAMIEQATNCILSDLNLENALNGVVCDCDFIQTFLKGLGVSSLQEVNTTGMIRLNFTNDLPADIKTGQACITFDQGELVLFENTYVFSFIAGNSPTIKIYGPNADINISKENNIYKLSKGEVTETDNGFETLSYFVDIPVYGPAPAEVNAGSLGKIDENFGDPLEDDKKLIEYISSVVLVHDITPLQLPTTLEELIELTRTILPAASLTTRANSISYITHRFPSLKGVSMVLQQDVPEMQRSTTSITNPLVDLYIKGPHTIECTEYFTEGNIGLLQHIPLVITDVTTTDSESTTSHDSDVIKCEGLRNERTEVRLLIDDEGGNTTYNTIKLYDASGTPYYITLQGGAGSEHLSISTELPDDATITDENTIQNADTGGVYSINVATPTAIKFTKQTTGIDIFNTEALTYTWIGNSLGDNTLIKITYLYDPVAEAVIKHIKGPTCKPAFDLKVCPFITAHVKELKIKYRKTAGKFFDRQKAIVEINDFLSGLTYPTIYDDAYLGDIMMACGASGIDSISVDVDYQLSGATGGYTENQILCNTKSLYVSSVASELKNYYGIGVRNINYVIPNRENIKLEERNTANI